MNARALRQVAAAFSVVTVCSACSRGGESPSSTSYQLDGRSWHPVQKNVHPSAGRNYVLELLPEGQTLDDWKELVTVEYFVTPKQPVGARDFEKAFLDKLAAGHPGVGYHVVFEKSADDLVLTWQAIADARLENQQGLVRINAGKDAVQVIEYTSRQPLTEEQIQRWTGILQNYQP